MSQIEDIRAILFIKAKEFKTTDTDILAEINQEISINMNIVSLDLGVNYNLGVALFTAHNLKLQSYATNGQSGTLKSEEIDDHKVVYQETKSDSLYSLTPYGVQYEQLLETIKNKREFWGLVV
jgi:hypothetical protein